MSNKHKLMFGISDVLTFLYLNKISLFENGSFSWPQAIFNNVLNIKLFLKLLEFGENRL